MGVNWHRLAKGINNESILNGNFLEFGAQARAAA
jgi:hypothetical protein